MGMQNGKNLLWPAFQASTRMGGFTLLEVLIAMALIAIGLVSLFGLQSSSLSRAMEAKFNNIAPLLASAKLAEAEDGEISMAGENGDFGDDYPGYTWHILVEDAQFPERKPAAILRGRLQRVKLTVSQNDTKFFYTLTAYVPRKQQ